MSDCNEDFYISEDNGMSEKTENYFRIRIRHNNPCWAEKTAYQVIRGQLQPFSAIVHKVHHTYVRTTSCYIQNNPRLLNYVWLMMGIFYSRRYRHEQKGRCLRLFQNRTWSLPNSCSVGFVFCAKQSPSVRLRLSGYGGSLRTSIKLNRYIQLRRRP